MQSSRSRKAELARLGAAPFAHRGLHGGPIVENSGGAIAAARDAGFGVEIDVRLSRDGEAMVFHDATLDRLTIDTGPVAARSAAELQSIRLYISREVMPRLSEALEWIGGRVPLLVELKAEKGRCRALCEAVARCLSGYEGPVGIMSFDPRVGRWFARHAPHILRGLVVTEQDRRGARGRIERALAWRWSAADFLACDIRDLPSRFAARRRAAGAPVYSWTVRTPAERSRAAAHVDQIIFEDAP